MSPIKTAFVLLGFVVLGISAGAVYRELTGAGRQASASFDPKFAASGSTRLMPELRFVDGAGAPRSLADFRGRVVLLNLWATWCVPCRKEMPALDRLQKALGGPEFEVLALSLDQGGVAAVSRFFEEFNIRSLQPYVDQNGDALGKLGSMGIPLTMLIDRDGRELWRILGPKEWDDPAAMDRIRAYLLAKRDK